jgi:cytochrome c553
MPKHRTLLLLLSLVLAAPAHAQAPSPAAVEFFEKEVRPLLVERCLKCHGDQKPKGGLQLISQAAVLKGGDTGPAAVVGKPDDSLLIQAVRQSGDLKMPPKDKLKDREIETLARWVKIGLPWPEGAVLKPPSDRKFVITDEQRRFWAWQPVHVVPPAPVRDAAWARSDLDRYVLAGLEAKGLRPAKPADRRTLIRRATFDLTGLPPTPEEIDAFLNDDSPEAFARVVDRLLASPAHGQRWGRHWLDVVRYTDSFDARGLGGPGDCSEAWRYRDWVVDAFNRDLPYDQFVTQQIAGDLLPAAQPGGTIATGVLAIGNWGGGDADKDKLLTDIADDQVDVVSKAFLGVTLSCARCHDHKFDPFSQDDYYGLAGIFFSTHILPNVGPKTDGPPMLRVSVASKENREKRQRYQARLADLEKHLKAAMDEQYAAFAREQGSQTARYLMAAWAYQNRPSGEAGASLDDFGRQRGLLPFALRAWMDRLGAGEYRLMMNKVRDVGGKSGVHGWRGEPDCPNLVVNTTDKEVAILTFKLPPKSVSIHPGPNNGVAVGWKSPVTANVRITGRVIDADPVGGDGVAWIIDHRRPDGRRELASGDIPNGGAQKLTDGKGAASLASVEVKAGDSIELLVLPKQNYGFDTTTVELVIATADGKAAWDIARDLTDDPHQGNPHRDRLGHDAVWHFYDMADSNRARQPPADPTLAAWHRAVASKATPSDLERVALDVQKAFDPAGAGSPFRIKDRADEKYLPEPGRTALAKLAAEIDTLKKNPPPPELMVHGAQEGGVPGSPHAGVHDVRVHIRGRYDRLGDLVPRHFPVVLAGEKQAPITEGSGRLQLAKWLASADNPLTARVMVNRLWQHHFGEGIVRSPSNFGKLGERPTHPELLDWLADQFVRSGWSMKAMHRLMMLSATYQQVSEPDADALKADPDNRLFGRMNRHRLEAEEVRDSLLAVSGRLDPSLGGKATRDFNSPRRTLYQMTVRSDRSGFGPLFDAADPTAPADHRNVSTVAPQALFLMNHPFAKEQARALARRMLAGAGSDAEKLGRAYVLLYGRPATDEEVRIGFALLGSPANEAAWVEYCQVLLCANEFVYVD